MTSVDENAGEAAARPSRRAAIALGANLGARKDTLDAARRAIEALPGVSVLACSEWIETDPVGGPADQPSYLNGVLLAETIHPPRVLLRALKRLEGEHGRDRSSEVKNGPRTLDLDLLFVGDLRVSEPDLELPHPRMGEREFVLGPLVEIAPDEILPGGRTAREALERLRNRGQIVCFDHPLDAESWCRREREAGRTIGWVPVLENPHDGHLALVRAAAQENDCVIASVTLDLLGRVKDAKSSGAAFSLEGVREGFEAAGCAMIFTGTVEQFFPGRLDVTGHLPQHSMEEPGPGAQGLEGQVRRGHLAGVATLLRRLVELTEPDRLYLSDKNYQEMMVAKHMASDFERLKVVVSPASREASGLASSAVNETLADEERELAAALPKALFAARELWRRGGERDAGKLTRALRSALDVRGLEIEYAAVRDPEHWEPSDPTGPMERAVALIAVQMGDHRLVDSLELSSVAVSSPSVP